MSVVSEALRETGSSLGMVFRNPALRKLNLAFAGSAIGDWAYATAMAVWVYSVGGLTAVGIWGTLRLVIMTLVTPFASILVDRYSRKRIMVSADVLRGAVIFVCAFLVMTEAPVWTVFVLATLTSVFAAPFRPAVAALLPHLVERPEELDCRERHLEHDRQPVVLRRPRPRRHPAHVHDRPGRDAPQRGHVRVVGTARGEHPSHRTRPPCPARMAPSTVLPPSPPETRSSRRRRRRRRRSCRSRSPASARSGPTATCGSSRWSTAHRPSWPARPSSTASRWPWR